MDTATLLQQCEILTSSERSWRMVELGRISTTDESAKEVINELFGKTLYEQHLSLETCYGSRNIQIAMAALASSSSGLKRRAMSIIVLLGTDQDILNALNTIPLHAQMQAFFRMRNLRGRRRQAVIDTFLDGLEDWTSGDHSVYHQLLCLASKGAVEKHLPKIIDRYTAIDWTRLGKHHPEVARDAVLDWTTRSDADDYHLMTTINSLLTQWGRVKSNAAIDMALAVVPEILKSLSIPLSRLTNLQGLLEKRPREMVQLILRGEDEVSVTYESKVLRALEIQDLLALQERYSVITTSRLAELNMDQRLAIYNTVKFGWRSNSGIFPMNALVALPMNERVKEARRHLKLRTFEPEPRKRIPYIALLPWEESIELQNDFIKSPDADVRIAALQAQIESAKYDTDHLDDAIALVLRSKNDQDPVREAMTRALMTIPASRWTETHLIQLAQVIRHGLDAGDLSLSTLWHLRNLVSEILPWNPNWAVEQFQILGKERGNEFYVPAQFKATGALPVKDTMIQIAEAMSPILTILIEKKLHESLVELALTFNQFTAYWTDLLNALETAFDEEIKIEADQSNSSVFRVNHGGQILTILKEHRPKSYWNLILQLVERRSTFAGDIETVEHVHLYRQNLLIPYLTPGNRLYDLGKEII